MCSYVIHFGPVFILCRPFVIRRSTTIKGVNYWSLFSRCPRAGKLLKCLSYKSCVENYVGATKMNGDAHAWEINLDEDNDENENEDRGHW